MAPATFRSEEVALLLLLLNHIMLLLALNMGVLCAFNFCYAILCVLSKLTLIWKGKRGPGCFTLTVFLLSYDCYVLWLFLVVPWAGLLCVIVVFPDHTH